jgi:hypothetical protein
MDARRRTEGTITMSTPYQHPGDPSQPGPQGFPGQYAPPPPPAKKKRKWPAIVGGVVAFVVAVSVFSDGDKKEDANFSDTAAVAAKAPAAQAPAEAPTEPATTATMNTPVRDGKFEFTVQKIKCGGTKVGDSLLNKTAQGQFCMVTLKVTNIGKESQMFDGSNQKAYGADGAQFSADDTAGLYANNNDDAFLNDINPGNSVTGTVIFDIPKTAKLAKLELHDSAFSGGVTVAVK